MHSEIKMLVYLKTVQLVALNLFATSIVPKQVTWNIVQILFILIWIGIHCFIYNTRRQVILDMQRKTVKLKCVLLLKFY